MNLAEGYGQVYAVEEKDVVTAIDQDRGEVVWQHDLLARRALTAPLAYSNYLVVGDAQTCACYGPADGRMMGREKVNGKGLRPFRVSRRNVFRVG